MKKYTLVLSALLMTALVGCGHQHTFSEATCEAPATCAECGATEGEALGHNFSEATCEAPATCDKCGATEGEALGHDFAPATLEAPKTCKNCGLTEGDKVSAKIIDTALKNVAILDEDRLIRIDGWDFTIYDAAGKVIKRFEPKLPNRMTDSIVGNYVVAMGDTSKGVEVIIYDKDGDDICSGEILKSEYSLVPDFYEDWCYARYAGEDDIEIYNAKSHHIICEIVPSKGEFLTTMEGIEVTTDDEDDMPEIKPNDNYENYEYNKAFNGYLVHMIDDDNWGFVDAEGNEIARYKDVCSYNNAGYTLATDDRETYRIIDIEQNVIADNFIEGKSSSLFSNGGLNKYIRITKADDTVAFIVIE